MNTANLYFDLVIDREYLTDWKDEKLPLLHVFYALHKDGTVEVKGWTTDPGVHNHLTVTQELKDQMQYAAQSNAQSFKWPVKKRRGRMRPEGVDAYQDIHDQWKRETGY